MRFYESGLILLRAIPSLPAPLPSLVRYSESFRGGRGEPESLTTPDWKSGVNNNLAN
ncbi:MAG: hypothetical protein KDD67_17680 [Ignavibacteriae bacterium]|nr:hypothetical protein [Ignavibacteriota bacterium]MCB9216852.1 hypothetical protein [Ignavibacteria bacterium]